MRVPYADFDRLVSIFSAVPGIGERGALRIALYLAGVSPKRGRDLARALLNVVDRVGRCVRCGNISMGDSCWICEDPDRDRSTVMMVETVLDLLVVEDTGYRGLYQVVAGLVPSSRRLKDETKREALARTLRMIEAFGVREVILAFPYTVRGESLFKFFREALSGRVALSRIARGVPVGADVELLDPVTLGLSISRRERV